MMRTGEEVLVRITVRYSLRKNMILNQRPKGKVIPI